MSEPVVAVLAYHRVGPDPEGGWESWFTVGPKLFDEQLAHAVGAGWQPLSLASFVAVLDGRAAPPPGRSLLVTFDDGYRSLVGPALASLRQRGLPAALFVPTDHVGAANAWDADSGEPPDVLCDWDELRLLAQAGVSVEAHGASHRAFSTLSRSELADELARPRRLLEERLGAPVLALAYPYGDPGLAAAEVPALAEAAGYRCAFLYDGAPCPWGRLARYHVPRIPVGADTDLAAELAR